MQGRAVLGQVVLLLGFTAAFLFLQLCGCNLEHHTLKSREVGVRLCSDCIPTSVPPALCSLSVLSPGPDGLVQ